MGAGIKEQFSDVFLYDIFGKVTGTFGSNQFPNVPCSIARFKARSANAGSFFIGESSGSSFLPFQLAPGDDTGWFAAVNLNRFWHNGSSGTTDMLAYWIQR